ncbi:MAG TPA: acyltransferase [Bacteroidales bacterium]|nr:acyltransferase [Bacteroidales bacterium]
MSRKNGIDLFRLIAAFFVMFLHTSYGNLNNDIASYIRLSGRWAVPFFFMCSGYFLNNRISETGKLTFGSIEKNMVTLISLLIVTSIVYLPLHFLTTGTWYSCKAELLFCGTWWHLWFISSLLFGYITITYFFAINKSKWLLPLSVIIALFAIVADSYDNFFGLRINYDELARFLLSIPFMYLGLNISKTRFYKVNIAVIAFLATLGYMLQIAEAQMFYQLFGYDKYTHQFLFGSILMAVSLFLFALKLEIPDNKVSSWGRKYSLSVYLYHLFVFFFTAKIIHVSFPNASNNTALLIPFVAFPVILIGNIILEKKLPSLFCILNGKFAEQTFLRKKTEA